MKIKIGKTLKPYDPAVYGRPWIASIKLDLLNNYAGPDFDALPRGRFSGKDGEPGKLTFEAEPGSGVVFGQAAKVKGQKGFVQYAIVQEDGSLKELDREAVVEHLIARRNAGHISPMERYQAAMMVNELKKRFHLREDACSDYGVASQEQLIKTMADQGITTQDRKVVQLEKLSPAEKDELLSYYEND